MDKIRIRGGRPLSGEIVIGGAKNAGLPLMAAGLLTDERLTLTNVPQLADIETMAALLAQHGVAVDRPANDGRVLSIGGAITNTEAPYDIVRKMRASVLVLGPLVARVRRGAGVAARRLRHRHPAGRSAPEGPGAMGADHPARRRLCARQRPAGAARRHLSCSPSPASAPPRTC